jgi:hypothetical protein
MRGKRTLALASAAAIAAVIAHGARAADHEDGPAVRLDRAADITDVYAFMSPDPAASKHIVLIMNVSPASSKGAELDSGIDYVFRVRRVTGTSPVAVSEAPLDVTCNADGKAISCAAPNGLVASAPFGQVSGAPSDPIRVFGGLRSDPFFFDRDAFKASFAAGTSELTNPGTNAFAGQQVLGIVVELDVATAFADPDAGTKSTLVAVAGETRRKGG